MDRSYNLENKPFIHHLLKIALIAMVMILMVSCNSGNINNDSNSISPSGGKNLNVRLISYGNQQSSAMTYAVDDDGYYSISNVLGTNNIIYSDFKSVKSFILCGDAGCNHMHEGCNSFLPGNGWMFSDGDKLYYISFNLSDTWGEHRQQFCVMEKNGGNRRVFYEPVEKAMYDGDHVCTDGENLYTYLVDNGEKYLYRIGIESGSVENLRPIDEYEYMITAFDQFIVFSIVEPYDKTQYMGPTKVGLRIYDVTNGDTEDIYPFDEVQFEEVQVGSRSMYKPVTGTGLFCEENVIYYMNNKDLVIHRYDFRKKSELWSRDLKDMGFNYEYGCGLLYYYEDKAVISYSEAEVNIGDPLEYMVIDLNNGEMGKITVTRYNQRYHREEPFYPFGFSKNRILYGNGGVDYEVKMELPDGSYELITNPLTYISYIELEDVINNSIKVYTMSFVNG
jgi:hypothetical protein